MTLLIAFLLLAQTEANSLAYVAVTILWLMHITFHVNKDK